MDEIPIEVQLAVGEAVDEQARQRAKWREAKKASAAKFRAEKAAQGKMFDEPIRPKQARFCHLLSLGLPMGQAYIEAGYLEKDTGKVPEMRAAMMHGSRLLAQPKVKAYYDALRQTAFLANVLSLAEKRSFLADVVRTPVGEVDVGNKLAQGVRYRDGEMVEMKMPDKISAVKLDAQLAGELIEKPQQINVGIQMVNARLDALELPKLPDD
jgi:phage terminase small subunit